MSRIEPIDNNLAVLPISPIDFSTTIQREPPKFFLSNSLPLSANSSIKPSLAHPDTIKSGSKSVVLIMANILNRLESFKERFQKIIDLEMDAIHKSSFLNLEKHEQSTLELEKVTASSDYWDFLTKIGAYLAGAVSIVLGASCLVPGADTLAIVIGSSLILSGGSSIIGSILSEIGTHPQLATALMITGSGLAIAGSCFGTASLTSNIGKIIAASLSVVTSSAEIIKDKYLWEAADIKAFDTLIRKINETHEAELIALGHDLNCFEKDTSSNTTQLIVAQRRLQASITKITELSA